MDIRDLPYTVVTGKEYRDAEKWCLDNIGPRWFALDYAGNQAGNWTRFWVGPDAPAHYNWHFRYEKDAMMFILRWT